jgi:hypothetical protein
MAWPTTVLDIAVEIYVSGAWVDITSYVRRREGAGISITDGTTGTEQRRASPSQATFQLNNKDGRFSPRNPASPYYRLIGINTPIRISAEGVYQFWGEVSSGWPTEWTSGAPDSGDAWVPLQANGRSQRLNADTDALPDPLFTAFIANQPFFYWPMTDPAGATVVEAWQPASLTIPALQTYSNRPPVLAGSSGPPGSSNTPDFTNQGGLVAELQSHVASTFQVICWFKLEGGDSTAFGPMVPWQIDLSQVAAQSPTAVDIIMYAGLSPFSTPGIDRMSFNVAMYENYPPTNAGRSSNLNIIITGAYAKQDVWHELRVVFEQTSGAVITASLYLNGSLLGSDATTTGTWVLGSPTRVVVNPNTTTTGAYANSTTGVGIASIAHLVIDASTGDMVTYEAGYGYAGEHAGRRIERLALQLGIPLACDGDLDLTATMGPQSVGAAASSLFEEATTADGGLLADDREALGLRYVTRQELYNQTAALALSYTGAAEVMPSLVSDESTARVANAITATSAAGTAYVEQTTGPRSVNEPDDPVPGIGRYPTTISPNVDSVTQLNDAAAWAVRVATADVPRFTSIKVNLFALAKASKTALAADAAAVAIGQVVTITDTPIWIPDDVACFAVGRTVRLANYEYDITYNTVDATVWQDIGGPLENTTYGRLDSEDTYLLTDISSGDTTILVKVTGDEPTPTLWTHADGDFHVTIGDEELNVTAVSTVTPALVAVGTAAHADNGSVVPGLPGGATAKGNLLLLYAATRRNDDTAFPNTPAGWTALGGFFVNATLFGKIHDGSESAPTVTFTGTSAGDTCSAQIASFTGAQLVNREVGLFFDAGPVQDIGVGELIVTRDGCLIIQAGFKQDDWTSVATLSGAAEIAELTSTLGNDMGLVWDWRAQGARSTVAATSFVVTGGGTAAVQSGIMAIDGAVQQWTVTRGQHDTTAAAHSADDQIRLSHPLILGW